MNSEIQPFLQMTLREIIEELSKPKHPTLKYPRPLSNTERSALFRARKEAKAKGQKFDEQEWVRENVK